MTINLESFSRMLNADSDWGDADGVRDLGGGGISDKKCPNFENYRHMLNTDSDGGGGQM